MFFFTDSTIMIASICNAFYGKRKCIVLLKACNVKATRRSLSAHSCKKTDCCVRTWLCVSRLLLQRANNGREVIAHSRQNNRCPTVVLTGRLMQGPALRCLMDILHKTRRVITLPSRHPPKKEGAAADYLIVS